MVNDSFVPSSKQPSVIYCKLTDFKTEWSSWVKNAENIIFFMQPFNISRIKTTTTLIIFRSVSNTPKNPDLFVIFKFIFGISSKVLSE